MTDPTKETYSFDAVYAAMCLWEEIIQPQLPDAPAPWNAMIAGNGYAETRSYVLALGPACDAAWTRACERSDAAVRAWETRRQEHEVRGEPFSELSPRDPGSFDWEFVPVWARECVDWSDVHNGPRVKGSKS